MATSQLFLFFQKIPTLGHMEDGMVGHEWNGRAVYSINERISKLGTRGLFLVAWSRVPTSQMNLIAK